AGVDGLQDLAVLAEVSHRSGSAFSQGCHRIADALVASAADHRTAAAERARVFIALPLAACFLPAFMIIGLAPVVLGLGMKVLGTLSPLTDSLPARGRLPDRGPTTANPLIYNEKPMHKSHTPTQPTT